MPPKALGAYNLIKNGKTQITLGGDHLSANQEGLAFISGISSP